MFKPASDGVLVVKSVGLAWWLDGAAPYTRPGKISASMFPLVRAARSNASGAVSAGSNPAEGTVQRHKFEHNL